jgi:hypothetical protein
MTPATYSMKGSGATIKVLYPRYCGSPVMAQKSRYDWFPPVAQGRGTKHPIPDKVPPLLDEEEGLPT